MNFDDFASIVANSLEQLQYSNSQERVQVGVEINVVGTAGGTPIAEVYNVGLGFDWDRNKFIIRTTKPLRETSRDEIKEIREKYDELGDSLRTIRELKRENKKLKEDHQDFRELLKKYREIVSDECLSDEEKLANIKASITTILIG